MNKNQNLKSFVKKNFRGAYDVAGAFKNGLKVAKARRETEGKIIAIHASAASADAPLKKITVNTGPNRLNLVFRSFSKKALEDQGRADFLITAVKFASEKQYVLRLISRNNQANPRDLVDFLKIHNLESPAEYSFYTDSSVRLSSPVRRLDISSNDVIFTENNLAELKEWIKDIK